MASGRRVGKMPQLRLLLWGKTVVANVRRIGDYRRKRVGWRIKQEIPDFYIPQVVGIESSVLCFVNYRCIYIPAEEFKRKVVMGGIAFCCPEKGSLAQCRVK
jgi:hypothetical protein